MDPWFINFMADYLTAYSANWGDLANDNILRVTGKAPRSMEQFARDYAAVFGKK